MFGDLVGWLVDVVVGCGSDGWHHISRSAVHFVVCVGVFCCIAQLVGWCVDEYVLADLLVVSWLVGWLVGWSVSLVDGWLIGGLVGCFLGG